MSDELPAGSVSLEDDAPAAALPVAAPSAVAEPPAPPPPDDQPAEVDAVEVAGQRYVPVSAVIAERQKRQNLEPLAARAQALEQQLANQTPYVQFLQAHPELMTRQADPVPAPAAATSDPRALQAAKLMDFYTPEGKHDESRGAQWVAMQEDIARTVANAAVAPMQQQTARAKSEENFQRALQVKNAQGRSPTPASLRAVWNSLTPEHTADERVAVVMALTAIGADSMAGVPAAVPVVAARPALETEPSGGQPRPRNVMSGLETRLASERGRTADQWQGLTKGFNAGRPNMLED